MFGYMSVQYATSNEHGREEIVLERHPTVMEMVRRLFSDTPFSSPIKEKYIFVDTQWVEKWDGSIPGIEKQSELFLIKNYLKHSY